MGDIKRVIAAFDLSPMGRRVADRARIVAEANDAELCLVHVGEIPDVQLPDEMLERIRLYRHSTAENLLAWINARANCPVELSVVRGNVGLELVKLSKKADLLMTGTSSVDHFRVGPRTTRLARKAHASLLAVRRQPRVPYRRVVAAVDLSPASGGALDLALQVAPDAEVTAVVALPSHAEMLLSDAGVRPEELDKLRHDRLTILEEGIEKFVADWSDRVAVAVVDGPPAEAVAEFARRRNADLVVAASRGAGGSNMVLLGSVAEAMLETAPCDVAVARAPGPFRRP